MFGHLDPMLCGTDCGCIGSVWVGGQIGPIMGQSSNTRARPGPNILHHWCYLQEELDPPLKTSNGPFASVLKPIISYLITDKKTLILLMKFLVFIFVKCQTFILDDPKAHVLPGEV